MKSKKYKSKNHNIFSERIRVGILGAGAGGVAAALQLANQGFQIDLFEEKDNILLGSSNATPGRAGHGFHYIHPETGIFYLTTTLEVLREFPDSTLGAKKPDDHYLRHGIYVIMKQKNELSVQDAQFASLFQTEEILATYEKLRAAYRNKIVEDAENELFGDPQQFCTVRDPKDFAEIIDISKVDTIIDTREELLNWPLVREKLCVRIQRHPNITVHLFTKVRGAHYDPDTQGFRVETNKGEFPVSYVINSTWENIEFLNDKMGFYMAPNSRTNRLKVIIKVALPESLRNKSSMFFCMGPHCMFSNMGDGTGMLTYAPVTNMISSTALTVSSKMRAYLTGKVTLNEKMELATKVRAGAALYIPALREAEILDVGFGIIKTLGTVDVYDPHSRFHQRDYLGIEEQQIGWIDNACMKLLHFMHNAKTISRIVETHVKANQAIRQIQAGIAEQLEYPATHPMNQIVMRHLQRCYSASELQDNAKKITEALASVICYKAWVMQDLRSSTNKKNLTASVTPPDKPCFFNKKKTTTLPISKAESKKYPPFLLKSFFTLGCCVLAYRIFRYVQSDPSKAFGIF